MCFYSLSSNLIIIHYDQISQPKAAQKDSYLIFLKFRHNFICFFHLKQNSKFKKEINGKQYI